MQTQNVHGIVSDTNGDPVVGATVIIESSGLGSITDADGKFTLNNAQNGDVVEVSSIGYRTLTFTVVASKSDYNIVMEIDGLITDEVVVTALGLERKAASLTYSTQQIGSDEFTKAKDVNVINSLQGKTAGLVITPNTTGAGSSSKILMRGNKSASGSNTPLIVIDGIPMNNPQTTQVAGGYGGRDGGDALSTLNPDDIKSINLLKGASAAALYGSMAANGVLMVTTKKGAEGTVRVNFSSNMNFETILAGPELQSNYGAATTADGGLELMSWGPKLTEAEAASGSNRVDEYFRTGSTYINSVSITGGTDKVQSYLSYANTYAAGITPTNTFNRHNLALRESFNLFNDRLTIDASATYVVQDLHNQQTGGTYTNPLTGLYTFPNNGDFNYYKNNYIEFNPLTQRNEQIWYTNVHQDFSANPYWVLNRNPSDTERERIATSASAKFKVTDYLNLQGRISYESTSEVWERKMYDGTSLTLNGRPGGDYRYENTKWEQLYGDVIATFNKQYGKFNISASAGTSFIENTTAYHGIAGNLVFTDIFTFPNVDLTSGKEVLSQSLSTRRLNSVFATAQIGYNDYLFLDVSGRNDWSSTLAFTDNTSYFYPSVGLSFLANEVFDLGGIDLLKLRGSYTIVGNDVGAYLTNPLHSITAGQINLNTKEPFTELQPEKMHSFEMGIDFAALNNNLTAELTYYKSNNKNQLFSIAAPTGTGYESYYINSGNIQNQGVEFTVGYDWQINQNWRWMSSINGAYNDNKILELDDELPSRIQYGEIYGAQFVLEEGGSFGDIYGQDFQRDDNGVIVVDEHGAPQKTTESVYLGNMNSDWTLGWSNNFRYKDWSASFLIDGRIGGKTYSGTENKNDLYGVSLATGIARDNGGVDIGNGTLVDAKAYYTAASGIAAPYVYDATNFRLRELTFGYTFRNLFNKSNSISVDFVARNLFFIYKNSPKDPDTSVGTTAYYGVDVYSLPSTRNFGLKVQFNF